MTIGAGGTGRRFWAWVILHLNHVSWLLTAFTGDLLLRSLLKALLMKSKHASENKKFDADIPQPLRDEWLKMIRSWESDKSKPNPYTHNEKGESCALCYNPLSAYVVSSEQLC